MPGIFGALGCHQESFNSLQKDFLRIWKSCEFLSFFGGCLGGHAFGTASALYASGKNYYFAINGEALSYSLLASKAKGINTLESHTEFLDLAAACKGSVVIVDLRLRVCHLAAEHTGTFPLYYAQKNGSLLFSSHIKPLASALHASPDQVGIIEFLFRRYTFNGRTHFQKIFRLLPGQVISYYLDSERIIVRDPKITWLDQKQIHPNNKISSEVLWDALTTAVKGCFDNEGRHALMMSGGWDSRVLLCAMLDQFDNKNLCAYSFGEPHSRELKLASQICNLAGIECIQEPLDEGLYEPDYLQKIFHRVENTLFPHWHRAAERLAGIGVRSVSAGVYGEVLGGHYGPGMFLNGKRKFSAAGRELFGLPVQFNILELLRFPIVLERPSFLTQAFWDGLIDVTHEINADIESSLQQLANHDLESSEQLIEAFVALNRGSTFINQQLLSCRTTLDVALPFINFNFLKLSSQVPLKAKIHNSIHRNLLQKYGSPLLQFPTAATLVPAFMPIQFQEASRVIRILYDEIHKKLNKVSKGYIGPPPTESLGLEFLRNGNVLRKLLDDLRCDIWDRNALARSIAKAGEHKEHNILSLSYSFLKIYTTDLMLR